MFQISLTCPQILTNARLENIPVTIAVSTQRGATFVHVDLATNCHQTGKSAKVRIKFDVTVFIHCRLPDLVPHL